MKGLEVKEDRRREAIKELLRRIEAKVETKKLKN